jgi:hypothetical protein
MRLALLRDGVAAAQRDMDPARLAIFAKPPDPRRMWRESLLSNSLSRPAGLAVADFDADGLEDVAVGESAGAKRLILFSKGRAGALRQGRGILGLRAVDGGLLVIEERSVSLLQLRDVSAPRSRSGIP